MNNENLSFKIKHPIAFSVISFLTYLFLTLIISLILSLTIFYKETYNNLQNSNLNVSDNQTLTLAIASILVLVLYVFLTGCIHIYKIKSLKEMFKNTYIISIIFLILLALTIVDLISEKTSFKKGFEMLPGFIKIFQIAFVEETIFRGILCRFTALKYGKNKKGIFLSIFLSGAIFGLAHILNLTNKIPLIAIIQQSVFAFAVGCFFAGMYLKSGNLWEPILIHFLIDFTGLFTVYFTNSNETFKTAISKMGDVNIIQSIIRFAIIMLLTYLIYLRKNKIENLVSSVSLMKENEI